MIKLLYHSYTNGNSTKQQQILVQQQQHHIKAFQQEH